MAWREGFEPSYEGLEPPALPLSYLHEIEFTFSTSLLAGALVDQLEVSAPPENLVEEPLGPPLFSLLS